MKAALLLALSCGVPAAALKAGGVHPNLTPLFNVKAAFSREKLNKFQGLTATIDNTTNRILIVNSIKESKGAAWARLADRLDETGWMELHVDTPKDGFFSNDLKMYAAGVVEGYLTAERMSQFYTNFYPLLQPDQDSMLAMMNVRNIYNLEIQHIMRMCKLTDGTNGGEPSDPYWKQMRYLFIQLWGLKDAYNLVAQEKDVRTIDMVDMFFINSHAELPELIQAYKPDAVKDREAFQAPLLEKKPEVFLQQNSSLLRGAGVVEKHAPPSKEALAEVDKDWKLRLAKRGHCSALVRLAPKNTDLLVGHTTWSDYSKMTRVFKYYNFHLPLSFQSNQLMAFSSYPGCVSSTDDFYMMENGLAVMDTSLEVLNPKVYNRVPEFPKNPRVPKFMHVMAVNRVAKTGAQWTSMFAEQNLGTGNSQWIVVDYNRFIPGQPLGDNALRVLEQVPGMSHQADLTTELCSRGYWAGYNRPFFQDTRRMSGHEAAEEQWGAFYSFENSPRGNIMRMAGSTVSGLKDMRAAMTRNDAKDVVPGQPSGPGHAISARLDLDSTVNNIPNGGIDAKITGACLMKKMACQAISGPSHSTLQPFKWKTEATATTESAELFQGWPHLGLPDLWNFDFVQMTPAQDKKASFELSDFETGENCNA